MKSRVRNFVTFVEKDYARSTTKRVSEKKNIKLHFAQNTVAHCYLGE